MSAKSWGSVEIEHVESPPGVPWFRWQLQRGESGLWWGGRKRGGVLLALAALPLVLAVVPALCLALALDPAYRVRWKRGA